LSALTESSPARRLVAARNLDYTRLSAVVLGGLLVARVVLSLDGISRPGLQYDETLFVNAATLRIPGLFLTHSVHGIPLMVFPYIGALKSWLYDPLFAVFGTSPTVIRLPVVLLVCAGLVLLYLGTRELISKPVAILAFAVLCFDNSIFWLTRDDVGPSALEFFFKCAALFCAARFARGRSGRWLVLLLAVLALGVFNKLNFIWAVNAAAAVSVLVMARHRVALRSHRALVALWVGGLALLYGCFALYYFGDHIGSLGPGPGGSSLSQRWTLFEQGTRAILSGTWFYDYALGPLGPRNVVVWIVVVLFAAGTVASVISARTRNLAVGGLAVATLLIALQNVITRQATAGWHYVGVYPFVIVVAAYGAYALTRALLRRALAVSIGLACVGAAALAYQGVLMAKYFSALAGEPANPAWSPAIYRLSKDLRHTDARLYTADWGILDPLFALHPSRRYTELAFAFESPTSSSLQQLGRSFRAIPGRKLILTHAAGKLEFPRANANLFTALGKHLRLMSSVAGRDGKPVFLIYAYR
jgi:4-amino-4-deoxy-L-arabinose transferase-like glycosyltransferase